MVDTGSLLDARSVSFLYVFIGIVQSLFRYLEVTVDRSSLILDGMGEEPVVCL